MDHAKLIEKWFADHEGEDDFFRYDRTYPFDVIGLHGNSTRVIYCTKRNITDRIIAETAVPIDCGILCGGGLPNEADLECLHNRISIRDLIFIGDMDPEDIMIFGWLRASLQSIRVAHLGINERLIARLQYTMPEPHRIPLGPAARSAVSRLQDFLPDARAVLGAECIKMLESGFKVELEAILLDVGNASQIMKCAIEWPN